MEAARNNAAIGYFNARPHLDSRANRDLFDAGFERGFKHLWHELQSLKAKLLARPEPEPLKSIDIVLNSPPSLIGVMNADNPDEEVSIGKMVRREDGYYALRIQLFAEPSPRITREQALEMLDDYFNQRQTAWGGDRMALIQSALLAAMGLTEPPAESLSKGRYDVAVTGAEVGIDEVFAALDDICGAILAEAEPAESREVHAAEVDCTEGCSDDCNHKWHISPHPLNSSDFDTYACNDDQQALSMAMAAAEKAWDQCEPGDTKTVKISRGAE
jgi:hypothetical protein